MTRKAVARWVVLCAALAAPAVAKERDYPLGPYGVFHVDVPDGWTVTVQGREAAGGPAIRIDPPGAVPLVLLLTASPFADTSPRGDTFLTRMEKDLTARIGAIAVEGTLTTKRFEGPACRGFFVSATDRTVAQPTLQNFKYGGQGAIVTGNAWATFTILTNLPSAPERERALEIVRSSRHDPTAVPVPDKNGTVTVAYPGKAWRLLIDLPGFRLDPVTPTRGGGVRLFGENQKTGVIVSAFLELSSPGMTAVDHREAAWRIVQKNPGSPYDDVRASEKDGIARREYVVRELGSQRLDQKHVNVYRVHDGLWIDVHLSKVKHVPADDALFEAILASVRFSD